VKYEKYALAPPVTTPSQIKIKIAVNKAYNANAALIHPRALGENQGEVTSRFVGSKGVETPRRGYVNPSTIVVYGNLGEETEDGKRRKRGMKES